jgi:hypothetical protein
MANGTPVQLQSPIGASVGRLSQNIIQALIARKDLEIQNRRLEMEQQRIGLEGQRLNLDTKRVEAEIRGSNLERLLKMTAGLPEGATISDHPALVGIAREAFDDLSPEDFEAATTIPLSRPTVRGAIDEKLLKTLNELDPDSELYERLVNASLLGTPETAAEIGARGQVTRAGGRRAELQLEGMASFLEDPDMLQNAARVWIGMEPTISGIPGVPAEINTATVANIWLRLKEIDAAEGAATSTARQGVIDDLLQLGRDIDVPIGTASATEILTAYQATADGDFASFDESPIGQLFNRSDEPRQRVIRAFLGGVDMAEDAWVRQQPQSVQELYHWTGWLNEVFPEGEVKDQALNAVKQGLVQGVTRGGWTRQQFRFEVPPPASSFNDDQLLRIGILLRNDPDFDAVSQGLPPLSDADRQKALDLVEKALPTRPEGVSDADSSTPAASTGTPAASDSPENLSRGEFISHINMVYQQAVETRASLPGILRSGGTSQDVIAAAREANRLDDEVRSLWQIAINQKGLKFQDLNVPMQALRSRR